MYKKLFMTNVTNINSNEQQACEWGIDIKCPYCKKLNYFRNRKYFISEPTTYICDWCEREFEVNYL